MGKIPKITRVVDKNKFLNHELDWLRRCFRTELREGISEDRIIFTPEETYVKCFPSKQLRKDMPERFLESNLFIKSILEQKLHNGYFVPLDLIFWYNDKVIDVLGYKKLVNSLFYEVFNGNHTDYDESKKGYIVLDAHLTKILKGWKPMEKTLFIGYLQFLKMFKKSTSPPLHTVIQEQIDGTMIQIGVTKASKESFDAIDYCDFSGP